MIRNLIDTYKVFPYWKDLYGKLSRVLSVKNLIVDRELPSFRNLTDKQVVELLACLEEITAVTEYISHKYMIKSPHILELVVAEYI